MINCVPLMVIHFLFNVYICTVSYHILRLNTVECFMEHLLTGNLLNYGDIIHRCFLIIFNKIKHNTRIVSDLKDVIKIFY